MCPAPARKLDESTIVRFYRAAERLDKAPLPLPLSQFTLTNTPLGLGDTVVLTDLPRAAAAAGRSASVHSPSRYFRTLMRHNPHYREGLVPFWVAADALQLHYDLGNGHLVQRIQRAYGFAPDLRPRGCLVVPDRAARAGRVALHLEPGAHAEWQRRHVHPRAREVYPESIAALQRFMAAHPELEFLDVGHRPSGLRGVEDRTGTGLADTIALMATCEYFLGIMSGPMHLAAALDLKMVVIINFPDPTCIYLPALKDTGMVELEWFYPQSVLLHQEGEGEMVSRLSLESLERAFAGELYPYWSDRYLPLIEERL